MVKKKVKKSKANKVKKIKASLKLRKKPGIGGSTRNSVPSSEGTKVPSSSGKFYRVVVRDKNDFVMFRNHDVGEKGHVERLAGRRANGRWATVSWLIDKKEAHISKGILVGDNKDVKDVLEKLRRKPRFLK